MSNRIKWWSHEIWYPRGQNFNALWHHDILLNIFCPLFNAAAQKKQRDWCVEARASWHTQGKTKSKNFFLHWLSQCWLDSGHLRMQTIQPCCLLLMMPKSSAAAIINSGRLFDAVVLIWGYLFTVFFFLNVHTAKRQNKPKKRKVKCQRGESRDKMFYLYTNSTNVSLIM